MLCEHGMLNFTGKWGTGYFVADGGKPLPNAPA